MSRFHIGHAAGASRGNWEAMWGAVGWDHHHAGLIWNETTRAELRLALQVCDLAVRHSSHPKTGLTAAASDNTASAPVYPAIG